MVEHSESDFLGTQAKTVLYGRCFKTAAAQITLGTYSRGAGNCFYKFVDKLLSLVNGIKLLVIKVIISVSMRRANLYNIS